MVHTYTVKQPTVDDRDGLIAMHRQSWLDAYPDEAAGISREWVEEYTANGMLSPEGVAFREKLIREASENPDYYIRIATDETGRIAGFVDARRDEAPELCGLYIDKADYGSGLAVKLAEPAIDWLGRENEQFLWVAAHNARARKFYEKCGFRFVPDSEKPYKETPMRIVKMVREADR